jgi:hypothetical protein
VQHPPGAKILQAKRQGRPPETQVAMHEAAPTCISWPITGRRSPSSSCSFRGWRQRSPESSYLLAFSCKGRYFCPSCRQERVLQFSVWVAEEVLAPRQYVLAETKRGT